ncbi:unnamed protein product [Polarella glacialis]|uniref:Kinesin-like protein n=1 Tax=Polarella glacialis TaxID=89957 RepID=A0A813KS95_POLGL|nr:unnamed protein product [Polarella glacialis]
MQGKGSVVKHSATKDSLRSTSEVQDFADDDEKDKSPNVNVVVRLRPPGYMEGEEDYSDVFKADGAKITVRDPLSRGRMENTFSFNRVFLPEHGQEDVFEHVAKPLIDHLLMGFNSCCFAYGQTGSGKTHSVFGEGNADNRGMLARSIEYLFERIEAQADQKEVGMVVSFTEIYFDQVRDLGRFYVNRDKEIAAPPKGNGVVGGRPSSANSWGMGPARSSSTGSSLGIRSRPSSALGSRPTSAVDSRPSSAKLDKSATAPFDQTQKETWDPYLNQDLAIHESPHGLVFVEDLSLIPVTNIREVLDVANLGVKMRATFETRLNSQSSRSHTIFSVSIVQKSRNAAKNTGVIGSVVNFVDLAGSERLAKSLSEGRRFQEAVIINTSLSALGKVVLALASDKGRHIPYRDSKLTRILQNSLGGNSFTTMLTTIDPSVKNYEESLSSLFFADRCRNVQNRPVQNVIESGGEAHEKTVARLQGEIGSLRHQLEMVAALSAASGLGAKVGRSGQVSVANRTALAAMLGGSAGGAGLDGTGGANALLAGMAEDDGPGLFGQKCAPPVVGVVVVAAVVAAAAAVVFVFGVVVAAVIVVVVC